MKLSELVRLRRTLQNIYPSDYEYPLQTSLTNLIDGFNVHDAVARTCVSDIKVSREKINDEFGLIRQHINDYKNYVQSCINEKEKEYYELSDQIYQDSFHDDADYILTRRKQSLTLADEESKNLFISRLGMYNSWKYPAIEIRPAFGEISDYMKGCDPLYLLDTSDDLFKEVKKKWNGIFQRRLRYYTFDETSELPLNNLPDNQFGLICSVDYLNFKPMNIVKKLLHEFYTKLRPGGIAMVTYNNCDLPYAVRNVENRFCCYTPGNAVVAFAEQLGFEVVKSIDSLENISWLELRKPGELTTIRGGQTLGEILNGSDKPQLTKEERDARNKANGIKT